MLHTPLPVKMCNTMDRLDVLEPGLGNCRRDHRLEGAYTGNDHAARDQGMSCPSAIAYVDLSPLYSSLILPLTDFRL